MISHIHDLSAMNNHLSKIFLSIPTSAITSSVDLLLTTSSSHLFKFPLIVSSGRLYSPLIFSILYHGYLRTFLHICCSVINVCVRIHFEYFSFTLSVSPSLASSFPLLLYHFLFYFLFSFSVFFPPFRIIIKYVTYCMPGTVKETLNRNIF